MHDITEPLPDPILVRSEEVDFNRLRCDACNRKIVHLLVSDPRPAVARGDALGRALAPRPHKSSEEIAYRAECPFCGDRSRPVSARGSVCPVPERGVAIVDVEMDGSKAFIRTIKR